MKTKGMPESMSCVVSKFVPFREVPILKRGAIDENHWSFQLSPFVVSDYFSVLAMSMLSLAIACSVATKCHASVGSES